jgi:hypothetical protein
MGAIVEHGYGSGTGMDTFTLLFLSWYLFLQNIHASYILKEEYSSALHFTGIGALTIVFYSLQIFLP